MVPNEDHQFLPKKRNIFKRDTKHFNQCEFIKEITQIKWDNVLQTEKCYANLSFNIFFDTIEEILDRHMPKRKLSNEEFKQSTSLGLHLDCLIL